MADQSHQWKVNTELCVPRHGGFLLGVLNWFQPVSLGMALPTGCTPQRLGVSTQPDAYAECLLDLSGS